MLADVERCDRSGFAYDQAAAGEAASMIRRDAASLAAVLESGADLVGRREPGRWSPLEYGCHVRDMLCVQRELLPAWRRLDRQESTPMGRDERVELDGCASQGPADVARLLGDAAQLSGTDLDRLVGADCDRQASDSYPERAERSLRWLAIRTVREVRHHLGDVGEQIAETVAAEGRG